MGGRGSYSVGRNDSYTYVTYAKVNGIKILRPMDSKAPFKLPEESHTAGNAYVLLDKNGIFHQYREYDKNHKVVLEIGYHREAGLGKGAVLHIHVHKKPGVENHNDTSTEKRKLTRDEYKKYKGLFIGVKINEREYFSSIHG